ncbi:bifunctional hydroxymethylpyrimidine kinase/phosphomethylpyrimidine kinase, partial [Metaclostridioides mangenotii]|uniref:bifunctional hydroxymethylpyrimidine kinase/phosphomethylpyrimidine kinase n=1 Tax=Metaclostridioides mangenotii TaxID=1540 RepID=UPI0026EAF436
SEDMLLAADKISAMLEGRILIKGGHLSDTADDLLYYKKSAIWIRAKRINNPNTHGTGCTLSSAIACNLAKGYSVE